MNRERVEGAAQSSHHYHPVPPKENLMADIEDPWNSRPIDVHRWSDHPEVAALADTVWDEYVAIVFANQPDQLSEQERNNMRLAVFYRWGAADGPWTTFAKVDEGLAQVRQKGLLDEGSIAALVAFYDGLRG